MLGTDLVPVLGHARVLDEGLGDARRRVMVSEGSTVVGVGAYEPLFGPHAEGVIAIREGHSTALVPYLLDELLDRVHGAGLVSVRFVFGGREQRSTAERLSAAHSHCALRRDWLDVRLEPAPAGEALLREDAA